MVFCTEFLDGWWSWEPHRKHDLRSGSQDHHPSKNSVQKTICYNSTSNARDDGRMYPKHVELRILTRWCRVLLEKLTGLQLVKKFPAYQGTRRFITALTSVRHLSILGQPNSVHIPTSHLLEIHPNIIHPSTPRYPQWSPSLRFPQQDTIHPPLLTHTRHMPSPSNSSRFYHPHKNTPIKLPSCIKLAFHFISWGRCTVKQP